MARYVKLIDGRQLETLTTSKALNYLDTEGLNNAGYKEFVPASYEPGKPYRFSYEETATQIIEHVEEIIPDPVDVLKAAKESKRRENDEKAEIARESQVFTVEIDGKECTFQTTRRTQQDLATAKEFIQVTEQPYQWFSDNNQEVYLTLEDVISISITFMQKANIYPIWSEYESAIDAAETLEEVQAIIIDYNIEE